MKKILTVAIAFITITTYSQTGNVGINTSNPSAALDIVSKDNTSATKALEINNSSNAEMVTVLNNGNVGIGTPAPNAKLDIRTSPTSTSNPGVGMFGLGTSSSTAVSAGAGALKYNEIDKTIQYSDGTIWNSLAHASGFIPSVVLSVRSSIIETLSSGQNKVLSFPVIDINDGNYNSVNSSYTIPSNGTYTISSTSNFSINNAINIVGLQISINNGSQIYNSDYRNITVVLGGSVSATLRLNAGDVVQIRGFTCVSGCNATLYDFGNRNFSIEKKSN